jgi:hypothetical protein
MTQKINFHTITTSVLCAALLAIGGTAAATENAGRSGNPPLIRGVLNTQTGTFTANPTQAMIAEAEASNFSAVTLGGTISFTFNITLKSGFPDTTSIRCEGYASTRDEGYNPESMFYDSKSVIATRTGGTATCKVSVFYSWLLANPGSTYVSLDYYVTGIPVSDTGVHRQHHGSLPTILVPPNGTTTNRTVNVTL